MKLSRRTVLYSFLPIALSGCASAVPGGRAVRVLLHNRFGVTFNDTIDYYRLKRIIDEEIDAAVEVFVARGGQLTTEDINTLKVQKLELYLKDLSDAGIEVENKPKYGT